MIQIEMISVWYKTISEDLFKYLYKKTEFCGFKNSTIYTCLFIEYRVIIITYVDNVFIYLTRDEWINDKIEILKSQEVDVHK